MKTKHRYSFYADNKVVISFLGEHEIEYDKDGYVTVFDDNERFNLINDFMLSHNAWALTEAVYTREEIENAQWLRVGGWENMYPQPQNEKGYIFTTYDTTNYCEGINDNKSIYYCEKGLVQKEPFMLKKEPNWGPRNFMTLIWVSDELFISRKAEEVLKSSNLTGFEIYDVWNKSKKTMEGIKQIFVKNYLPQGISADSIETRYVCPKCNFTKYQPKIGTLHFHKKIFEGIQDDIVKTTDKFWEAPCDSLILITHKFYEVVTNAKLDRGLVFEPVKLI